jgi:hypothetical protein
MTREESQAALALLQDTSVPHTAVRLYFLLATKYLNRSDGRCFPKQETIAKDLGMNVRNVQRALNNLVPYLRVKRGKYGCSYVFPWWVPDAAKTSCQMRQKRRISASPSLLLNLSKLTSSPDAAFQARMSEALKGYPLGPGTDPDAQITARCCAACADASWDEVSEVFREKFHAHQRARNYAFFETVFRSRFLQRRKTA